MLGRSRSDRYVSDRRVEPHVKHLVPKAVARHGSAPREIARDAARVDLRQPRTRDRRSVFTPKLGRTRDPALQPWDQGFHLEEKLGRENLGHGPAAALAARGKELVGLVDRAARVALVATRAGAGADRAHAFDEPVCKEAVTLVTLDLLRRFFGDQPVFLEFLENV